MAEHEELVAEMATASKLTIQERLLLAKRRRLQQLECYERQRKLERERMQQQQPSSSSSSSVRGRVGRSRPGSGRRGIRFDSRTRVFDAASRNDSEEVRSLLNTKECQPNSKNADGFTILHQCCIDGHLSLIRTLIEDFGSSVNHPDDELWTPLHTVALCGRPEVCKMLIKHGADLLALNIDGNMPYDICEDEETLDIIEAEMSKRGITQEQIEELRMTKERQMLSDLQETAKAMGDLERRGQQGETPLHIAAANGYLSVAKLLLDAKVTVDPEDNDFWQPIHCAAKWRQLPILELLIVNGAELTSLTRDGRTPVDLCDDPDIQSWMKELRREVETKQTSLVTSHQRLLDIIASKSSLPMLNCVGSNGQLYSSNMSLAEGATASSSNRHLPTSAKESIAKKSAQEESNLSLSLQSLVDIGLPTQTTQVPDENGFTSNCSNNNLEQISKISSQQLSDSQIQLKSCENHPNSSISNGHGGGQIAHTMAIEGNGQTKSCLKTGPATNRHIDESTDIRKRRLQMKCCKVS